MGKKKQQEVDKYENRRFLMLEAKDIHRQIEKSPFEKSPLDEIEKLRGILDIDDKTWNKTKKAYQDTLQATGDINKAGAAALGVVGNNSSLIAKLKDNKVFNFISKVISKDKDVVMHPQRTIKNLPKKDKNTPPAAPSR